MIQLGKIGSRAAAAVALATSMVLLPAGQAAAQRPDPVCIAPPEDFCTYWQGHIYNSWEWNQCMQWATEAHYGEYCAGPLGLSAPLAVRD